MKLCLTCNFQFGDELEHCPKDNAQLVPLSQDPLIGMVIQDRYKVECLIGKGTMGVVYKANQELIGRNVAVKVLHSHLVSDSESLKRFHQQAKAASRLNHPHIITLYDYGVIGGSRPYIVMDLLKGHPLTRLLEERGNLSLAEAAPIFKQICEALGDAHKHGVVHRDVKPDNIVLEDHNNQQNWVKVVDFGIAKLVQGSEETLTRITRTGTVCGSPTYMSPEQFQGRDVDHRSDIYSLGCVLFEVLTGRVPFTAIDLVGLMAQHVAEKPPRLASARPDLEFPQALEKMMERVLSKEPEIRQPSMDAFWEELEAALSDKRPAKSSTDEVFPPERGGREEGKEREDTAPAPEAVQPAQDIAPQRIPPKPQKPSEPEEPSRDARLASPDKAQLSTQKMPRSRATVPLPIRVVAFFQGVLPYAITLLLFVVLLYVASNDSRFGSLVDGHFKEMLANIVKPDVSATGSETPAVLVEQGKLAQARSALEERQDKDALSKEDFELLNQIYLRIAEQEAKAKHYKNAVALLEKVSSKSTKSARARTLLRKYRRLVR